MRSFRFMLLGFAMVGCSPDADTTSNRDDAAGDSKLAEAHEMQVMQNDTNNDYNKMTQVDPNLRTEAMDDYDKAIEDDPENAEAYYKRGFALLSHSNALDAAVVDFNKAIELKPDYARAYLMRGRAYESLGDTEKANADRAKALELQPDID
ncbi:MAG TPA: tetratricopeptide repeat protein [Planctomycetes bacterium]|nr:tetratricopeptide repeat protein [Planctomycetota bacterium]